MITRKEIENANLVNNKIIRQLEITVKSLKAIVEYQHTDGKMFLIRSEVPESIQKENGDEIFVEKIMFYLEENKIELVPMCALVKNYLRENSHWKKLLVTGIRL